MRKSVARGILLAIAAAAAWTIVWCSNPDAGGETIASVDGDVIKVQELREFLGVPGQGAQASGVPVEQKRLALDRLVAGRLLEREARAKGLDNTDEFRDGTKRNGDTVLISALFRREASKIKISKGDIEDEAKKLKAADKALSQDNATLQAGRIVTESKLRKIEEDLVATARKETPPTINQAELDKLAKGGKLSDAAVLATVGDAKLTYGDVKTLLGTLSAGQHGGKDLSTNAVVVARMVEREAVGKALVAHARKQGIPGSDWEKAARKNMERSILIEMVAAREVAKGAAVSDKEVADAYAQHSQMFVRNGKKVPLSEVKEQIRTFLQNDKRKKALETYVEDLKKKAKVTVNEGLMPKV